MTDSAFADASHARGVKTGDHPTTAPDGFTVVDILAVASGHPTLDELDRAFTDCGARDDQTRALPNTLFPEQPSHAWAVE